MKPSREPATLNRRSPASGCSANFVRMFKPQTRVSKIKITAKGFKHWEDEGVGVRKNPATLDAFAKRDGFSDWGALVKWFRTAHGLPFTGIVIHWQNAPDQRPPI
jgi:hypothetical protein